MTPARHVDDAERRARLGRRTGLATSARFADVAGCAAGLGALHSTEPATVHLAAWARVDDVSIDDVERALYDERSVVKQMAMRRTLFAMPRELLPAAWGSAGRRVATAYGARLARDLEAAGHAVDGARWVTDASDAIVEALADGSEMTSTQLRGAVPMVDLAIEQSPGKRWSASVPVAPQLLTVLHAAGRVTRAHNAGPWRRSAPTWTATSAWLGESLGPTDEREGYRQLVGRWLEVFGPGTELDVKWWLGGTLAAVRAAIADLGAVPVSLGGGATGWVLPDDLDVVDAPDEWVVLLPTLDSTVMGWKERPFYVGRHERVIYDAAGNAGTTAWWSGRVVGCWIQDDEGRVTVRLVEAVPAKVRQALDREAERLTAWLDGVRVVTLYVSPAMRP